MGARALCVLIVTSGCVDEVGGASPPDAPPPPTGTFGALVEPRLGDVFAGATTAISIDVAGVHETPGYPIDIQVLDDGSWVTIAHATTDTNPSSTDPSTYEWHVSVSPAQLSPRRWPRGGLLALRAAGAGGEILPGLFADSDACIDAYGTWRERVANCGVEPATGTIVVNPADPGASIDRPRYLDRRGWIDATETAAYYQTINAPATLADFRAKLALDGVAPAIYYNASDLGIGREMRCATQLDGGLACAVSNYGAFGGDQITALDAAIAGTGAFATVAMIYSPLLTAPNNVQFMVYGGSGALVTTARLDTVGDNESVPDNCLNCHGAGATYDATTHAVTGATFLPFDPAALSFSQRAGFTASAEAPSIAQLDNLVRAVAPRQVRDLIDGWYDRQDAPALDYVPVAWDTSRLEREVYLGVVAPYCRGCHESRSDALAFATAQQFRDALPQIATAVCAQHDMPNAEVPLRRLWSGPARAYLAAFAQLTSCDP